MMDFFRMGMFSWTCCENAGRNASNRDSPDDWTVHREDSTLSEHGVWRRNPARHLSADKRIVFQNREPTMEIPADARSDYTEAVTERLISLTEGSLASDCGDASVLESFAKSEGADVVSESSPSTKCSEVGDAAWRSSSSLQIDEGTPTGMDSIATSCQSTVLPTRMEVSEAAPTFERLVTSDSATTAKSANVSSTSSADSKAVIILDWDDTLCPTTWAMNLVESAKSEEELMKMEMEYARQLEEHSAAVVDFLRAARKVARVAVVTLASEEFFQRSAETFLEGARISELFEELGIKVYFAKRPANCNTNAEVAAKKEAMKRCLANLYPSYGVWHGTRWNVLSIGDSEIELTAIKQAVSSRWRKSKSLCKTCKLEPQPCLSTLTMQLRQVAPQLAAMVAMDRDFDRHC
ncbi:hypothetical protein AK812_SmicGene26298 [Symbiodinium microadriaticum]|uniref:Uncharacterized protein n=1 Tax=Symbiodinium microadriaticum TaxID=2951 RepID=A0A1Q9DA05_SYMMI|nr:hypothetical protein AK812_SmicGene26298 [Symbiodinium microadriaticum]